MSISYERSSDGTWGSVNVGGFRLTGRTAVMIAGAALWLLITVVKTGGGGVTAIWTSMLLVVELTLLTGLTRSIRTRLIVRAFLIGGFMLTLAIATSMVFQVFVSDIHSPVRDVFVPFMEEALKIAPVLFVLWRWRDTRSWRLGATDVLVLAVACGAGFGLVEDAYIRHASGWGQTVALLPLTEMNGDRLVAGHAIWTAVAGGTLGIALLLWGRTARGWLLGSIGPIIAVLTHMANNLTADGQGGLTDAIDKITMKGHLVFWAFVLVVLGSIAIDLVVTRSKLPEADELRPPAPGGNLETLRVRSAFDRERHALAFASFRYDRGSEGARERSVGILRSLTVSLVQRGSSATAGRPPAP